MTRNWLGLAYEEYRHRYYYFELIEFSRKLLLAAVLGPLMPANDLQVCCKEVIRLYGCGPDMVTSTRTGVDEKSSTTMHLSTTSIIQAVAAVLICGIFCIVGFLLQPFKVPGQNIAYNFALLAMFIITLVGFALSAVDELAPIGQPADPAQTREFGVRGCM